MTALNLEQIRENGSTIVHPELPAHVLFAENKSSLNPLNDMNSAAYIREINTGHTNRNASGITEESLSSEEEEQEDKIRSLRRALFIRNIANDYDKIFDNFMSDFTEEKKQILGNYVSGRKSEITTRIETTSQQLEDQTRQHDVLKEDATHATKLNEGIEKTEQLVETNPELRVTHAPDISKRQQQLFEYFEKHHIDAKGITREEGLKKLYELRDHVGKGVENLNNRLDALNGQYEKFEGLEGYINNTPAENITREKLEELGLTDEDIQMFAQAYPDIQNKLKLEEQRGYFSDAYDSINDLLNYLNDTPKGEVTVDGLKKSGVEAVIEIKQELGKGNDGLGIYTPVSPKTAFSWATKQPDNMSVIGQPQMSVRQDLQPQMSKWDPKQTDAFLKELQSPAPAPAPAPIPGV